MLTRRGFLGATGAGTLSLACCHPTLAKSPGTLVNDFAKRYSQNAKYKDNLLGYPINLNVPPDEFFQWRKELFAAGLNEFASNNVGDPFQQSSIKFNSHELEKKTVAHFGRLHKFSRDDLWGFLSNSGTDSNMHGMYMGRTILKQRTGRIPKVFFTSEAHYSIEVLTDLLGMEPVRIKTESDGSMSVKSLQQELQKHKSTPALVVGTVGTTFKGATDPVTQIRQQLAPERSYFHVDAALFGGYLPYSERPEFVQHGNATELGQFDSIAISCHKFFGFPAPAGLYLTTNSLFQEFKSSYAKIHNPEYIHHVPGTITCSRDAVKPAEFVYHTTSAASNRLSADAKQILLNTTNLFQELQRNFDHLWPRRSSNFSNTIYFRYPGARVCKEFSLATMHLTINGQRERFAHVVIMPHATENVLLAFLRALPSK